MLYPVHPQPGMSFPPSLAPYMPQRLRLRQSGSMSFTPFKVASILPTCQRRLRALPAQPLVEMTTSPRKSSTAQFRYQIIKQNFLRFPDHPIPSSLPRPSICRSWSATSRRAACTNSAICSKSKVHQSLWTAWWSCRQIEDT